MAHNRATKLQKEADLCLRRSMSKKAFAEYQKTLRGELMPARRQIESKKYKKPKHKENHLLDDSFCA